MDITKLSERASLNDREAQSQLCLAYLTGDGVEQNKEEGWKWFAKASEEPDVLESIITPDAVSSHPDLCRHLIEIYSDDKKKSNLFLIPLAKSGDAVAERALGIACRRGRNIPEEYCGAEQAECWLLRAVEHGEMAAHRDLYELYAAKNSEGMQNLEKAFAHLQQIVEDGRINDSNTFGKLLIEGIGVAADEVEGVKWLYLSACRLEEGPAWERIRDIHATMSEGDYIKSRDRAHEWINNKASSASSFNIYESLIDPITGEQLEISLSEDSNPADSYASVLQNENIRKWHEYCLDEKKFDSSELIPLFFEDPKLTTIQLEDLFRYYDERDEVIEKFSNACDSRFGRSASVMSLLEIGTAARDDLHTKLRIVQSSPEHVELDGLISTDLIDNAQIELAPDYHDFLVADSSEENPNDLLSQILDDSIDDYFNYKSVAGYYGLRQALYGVLADYTLMYYVLSAFSNNSVDFTSYLKLKNAGAQYALVKDKLIVYVGFE